MSKFYNTIPEEQETIININYSVKEVSCYTSRKTQIERLTKKLGDPTKTFYTNKKISGATWIIPFCDKKKITNILSRPLLIGNII